MTDLTRRAVAAAGLATLVLPWAGAAAAQAGARHGSLWFVDPALRPAAARMQEMALTRQPFSDAALPAMRKGMDAWTVKPRADVPYAKRTLPGPKGAPDVAVVVVNAKAGASRGEVPVAFQCLIYPMLDDRTGSTRPVKAPIGTLLWSAEANRYGWRSFLGGPPGGTAVPAAAVPARVAGLRGLPPAWVGVGSIDLFISEDVEYARRLIEADVPTELLMVPGAFHGFDGAARETGVARRFTAAKVEALARGLAARP